MDADRQAGDETEFEGVYLAQWEIAHFAPDGGRRLRWLGLKHGEKWLAHFPSGASVPTSGLHERASFHRMRVRGRIGPRGRYGHMGICQHELFVSEILDCQEVHIAWWRR